MRSPAGLVLLLAVAALSACRNPEQQVVAWAGGQPIYFRHLLQEAALARARGVALDSPSSDKLARFYNRTVERLVDEFLLAQEAERRGLRVPESLLETEVQRFRSAHASGRDYERVLASYHLTEQEFKHLLRRRFLVERLAEVVGSRVEVSLSEVRAYYTRTRAQYRVPARGTLDAVWVSRAASDRALDLLRRGASAAATAVAVGGRSERLEVVEGQFNGAVEAAVFRSAPGAIVGPFALGSVVLVARVRELAPGRLKSFREARGEVEAEVLRQKQEQALGQLARKLRREQGYKILVVFSGTPPPEPRPTQLP
ncbi:MAG: peptidylprolyl isomerase [Armatimonadota bacterium]|nr:peptidylprolyl isomerase [Armatimonadota bacterium]MDR7471130.1 peptidylprolyl isomerase [Armatimonadota bacterium]MDR7545481.1 peptidylprolyl isomerase [Armatimonadota bacterium]MDR7566673.1 peptidylprolyl isomerase [Armatimonadota bacterium]